MKNIFRNADGEINTQIVVAAIGAAATLLTAIIAGVFGLIQLQASKPHPLPPRHLPRYWPSRSKAQPKRL